MSTTTSKSLKSVNSTRSVDLRQPIFICGVGRSGTSLLQSMLCSHQDISFPPETSFFRRYVADVARRRQIEQAGLESFLVQLQADDRFGRLTIDPKILLKPFFDQDKPLILSDVYRRMLCLVAERAQKSRVGDKDPRTIEQLRSLARFAPYAKVIHLIRDPRDVVLSRTLASWSSHRPWWLHALVYQGQMKLGRIEGKACFGSNFREIRYEDLIAQPREVLQGICSWIGVPFDEGMLDFSPTARNLVSTSEMGWKRETLGPLLSSNCGKWKTKLTRWQIRVIETVCADSMRAFGYEIAGPEYDLDLARRAVLLGGPLARHVAAIAYRLGHSINNNG